MDFEDITYSREATIAAVTDYYTFLTRMYMKESHVVYPPAEGWPSIVNANPAVLQSLGKSDEVLALLSRLPYIHQPHSISEDTAEATPSCTFADWSSLISRYSNTVGPKNPGKTLRIFTEGSFPQPSPPHVIGLTIGGDVNSGPVLMLDTELGIIHWENCYSPIAFGESRSTGVDWEEWELEDEVSKEEADWRRDADAWAIPDLFEVLKDQFRQLHWLPISCYGLRSAGDELHGEEGMMSMLQDIYRQHGWPDLAVYRKSDCMDAVRKALAEKYPESTDYRDEYGEESDDEESDN